MKRTHCFTGRLLRRALALTLCAALAAGLFAGCKRRESQVPSVDVSLIELAPSAETQGVIALDSFFTVSFSEKVKLSEGEAQALFRFVPETAFTAKKQKDTFVLTPESPLPQNTVINLQAVDAKGTVLRSWAYQTQAALKAERSTPFDGAAYVPPDSGIEVVFSSALLSTEDYAQHFTLAPEGGEAAVTGSVLQNGPTMIFVPAEPLQEGTTYCATVDGALTTADGMALGESYRFSFRTADVQDGKGTGDYLMNASPIAETFVTGDAPLIAVRCDSEFAGRSVSASVYRFPSAEGYRSELEALARERDGSRFPDYVRPEVDVSALESLGTFEAEITAPSENYWGTKYIILPGDYAAGWYYVQVKMISPVSGNELSVEKLLQISDISLYHLQANGETLFWVNDAASGQPVSGAQLSVSGAVSLSGTTAADGTLRLAAAGEEGGECVLEIAGGERRFIDLYSAQGKREPAPEEQYTAYLYTDRPIYMSSDTIRAWGVVRPRAGVSGPPENLRLSLGSYEEEYYSVPVTLAPDGTFTAELSFDRLGGRNLFYTSLRLVCGDQTLQWLANTGIAIGDYEKPVYVPGVSLDRPVYQAGDMAQATFTASFFDNTPATGFSANLDLYGANMEGMNFTVTTGADGSAVQAFPLPEGAPAGEAAGWRPQYLSLYASNAMAENLNFSFYKSVPVFWRSLAIRTELSGEGEERRMTVLTNEIDLSGILQESDLYEEENYIGAPADVSLMVEVHRTYYEKIPSGSYYDLIHKRNVTRYTYEYRDEVVDTYSAATAGGRCELAGLPADEKNVGYYLRLTATDGQGRLVEQRGYLGTLNGYYYDSGLHRYTFERTDVVGEDYDERYSFDESTGLRFAVRDNGFDVSEGRLLWALSQTGIEDYATESAPGLAIAFKEELVPNFTLVGAYFDGRYIYPVTQSNYYFRPDNRELDIRIDTDREKYAPGDTARIEILVTEKADGSPAADAAISLSLVDEAVFAIENREAQPLQELYRSVYAPDITCYTSYLQYSMLGDGGAEKGGGGGDEPLRTDFQDTAAFLTLMTDAAGKAVAEVPLPDNITSWRATVQAVTQDLHAGGSREAVIVTLPFFINEVLSSQFLEGDDAALTLRCAGGGITSDTRVNYTVEVEGPGIQKTESASGSASAYTAVKLGQLQRGSYTVTMKAESGEYSDGIQKTVQVIESGVQTQLSKTFALSEGIDIDPQRFPVRVGFYNADYAVWADVLDHLWSAWGGRTDERMALRYVQEKLCELSGEPLPEDTDGFTDVIDGYGYVSPLPYDSASVAFSARIHLAAPQYITARAPVEVFYSTLGYDGPQTLDTAYAYLGLAAHREPVLGTLRRLMEDDRFTDRDRLVLLAALAAIGDMETARGYYEELILPHLEQSQTGDGRTACFYRRSEDIEENLEWTASASLAASMLRAPEADGMMIYLIKNRSNKELYYPEEMVYLRHNEPQGKTQASVSYKKDGKTVNLNLAKTGMQFVSFVSEEFEAAQIKQKSGEVSARVYYTGGLQEALGQENRSVELEKAITPKEGTALRVGDIARIIIRPQMDERLNPFGMTVDDYIPSGLRFLAVGSAESEGKSMDDWVLIHQEGQKVTFGYYAYSYEQEQTPVPGEETYAAPSELVYYVRCAVPGTYVVDSACAGVQFSSAWGASERTSITIDE